MLNAFKVRVSDDILNDLANRLAVARLPSSGGFSGWDDGTPPDYLQTLVDYWRDGFNWRTQESRLNGFAQFRGNVAGAALHFIHERGKEPDPMPLLLVHGYPDSVWRFHKLIPLLTDPAAHGGDPTDVFDVVAPSLPGYGWSALGANQTIFDFGNVFAELMATLGYEHYGAHGGDWGSTVVELLLARSHAKHVIGVHLTDVPFWHAFQKPNDLSHAEKEYLSRIEGFTQKKGAYAAIQGTRPATLTSALNDSPAGLAGWIIEKFYEWSDCNGTLESRFTKDELLTNAMIYWVTQTIGSAFLPYRDFMKASAMRWTKEAVKGWLGSDKTPAPSLCSPRTSIPRPANGPTASSTFSGGPKWIAVDTSPRLKSRSYSRKTSALFSGPCENRGWRTPSRFRRDGTATDPYGALRVNTQAPHPI